MLKKSRSRINILRFPTRKSLLLGMSVLFIFLCSCKRNTPTSPTLQETVYSSDVAVIKTGRQLAKKHCFSCHLIQQSGIGPALGGITFEHDREWLYGFIKNSQKMVDNGDKKAVALLEKYKSPMPAFDYLKDSEIEAILSYIDSYSREKHVSYQPEGNNKKMKKLMTIPLEPIPQSSLQLSITDFSTLPVEDQNKRGPIRLANMRYRPDTNGNDGVYVHNHDGFLYHIVENKVEKVLDLSDHFPDFITFPGLASGFGSFAFHPDFAKNQLFYLTHTEAYNHKKADFEYDATIPVAMQWVVSEFKLDLEAGFTVMDKRELLRINVPKGVHGMQDINFNRTAKKGDEDYRLLYIGIGDGGATVGGYPQLCHTLSSPLGTILRIDPLGHASRNGNYGVPSSNPFTERKDEKIWKEIYAYGFRNPHRFTWYETDKRFLSSEISHKTFEEVNWISPGKDYGWNVRDANIVYDAKYQKELEAVPWNVPEPEYQLPFAVYSHFEGNAISGGYIYRGSLKMLQGKYIFGDIVSGRIFYIDLKKETNGLQQVYEFRLVNASGENLTLRELVGNRVDLRFGEDAFGEIYIMSKTDGKIRKVTNCTLVQKES